MRFTAILRGYQPRKRYVLPQSNEMQKPYWEYTAGELFGKDPTMQGLPKRPSVPRLAPHLNPRGLVESVPREMEDMSTFFNTKNHEFGDIDSYPVRSQFDDMRFFAKRYAIIMNKRLCSSDLHNPRNRDVFDIWLRDLKAKSEESQVHTGQKLDIELLGQYDGQPNYYNEKVISMDVDKILYYIGLGVSVQEPVLELLGILGYLPVHPGTELRMMKLHETRRNMIEDSGPAFDYGNYHDWAESQTMNMIHRKDILEDTIEKRKAMVEQRTILRERKLSGEDVSSLVEEDVSYDDDDDDDF